MDIDENIIEGNTQPGPEPVPSVTVSIVDGQVQVATDNLSILAAPTLLRLAANTVETEVGL